MIKELAPISRNSGMEPLFGWDPFSTVLNRRPVEKLFGSFPFGGLSDLWESDFNARIVDKEDSKQFKYQLPGVSKDNIQIEIIDNVLSVQVREVNENGERSYYSKITLDSNLDLDNVTAESQDGLLVISFPVKEPNTRRIPVNIGEKREALESGSLKKSEDASEVNTAEDSHVPDKENHGNTSENTG